jgi:hypothetical protein
MVLMAGEVDESKLVTAASNREPFDVKELGEQCVKGRGQTLVFDA